MRFGVIGSASAAEREALSAAVGTLELEMTDLEENKPEICAAYVLLDLAEEGNPTLVAFLKGEAQAGKVILGLKSSVKLLASSGLIPGLSYDWVGVALKAKVPAEALVVKLSPDYQYNAFTRTLNRTHLLAVTPASLEFVVPVGLRAEVISHGLDLFRSHSTQPEMVALANKNGNVMALLPFPGAQLCAALLTSMHNHLLSGYIAQLSPLDYWPRRA